MPDQYLRYKVLWPLVPAMAMVMIDFTIVSISATTIQQDLGLSETGQQWLVTAYALATAAFVALGGRLGDIIGHQRIVVIGIVLFAVSSLLCGLVPDGSIDEAWLIVFRALQGVGGALLIPSATVLVLNAFPPDERGKGLSVFFIVTGLFTALGPIAGSYLTEFWTWRAIFWINVPVALLALVELHFVRLKDSQNPAKVDLGGAALLVSGMALTVLGIQQSTVWGLGDARTIGSVVIGLILLGTFVKYELDRENPLIDVRMLRDNRQFGLDNVLTFLVFAPWLAVFFFGAVYFQVAAGQQPTQAGFSILTMFYTFFIGSRVGGGMLDKFGAKRPVTLGFVFGTVGMLVWASQLANVEHAHANTTTGMLLTGFGFGLLLSALGTDALNRVPGAVRGEASGINQTFRNFGSAVGMAVMGTIIAGATTTGPGALDDFIDKMQTAWYVGAGFMAAGYLLAHFYMQGGRHEPVE